MSEYVQYYIVNQTLLEHPDHPMSPEKAAVQLIRAGLTVNRHHQEEEGYQEWCNDGVQKIILLKAKESKLRKWMEQDEWDVYPMHDLGLTQIPPNSLTAVVFKPYPKEILQPLLKRYRLF